MSSHRMKRPAPISVFPDQRRTKSTIWSRVSCGTQTPVRVPQLFFLGQHALPSVQPKPHLSSGSSAPDRRFVPVQADGWCVPFVEKPPLRSRKTPSASGRTRLAGVPVRHTDPRSALLPPNDASEWRPSLPACSASVVSSCVRSVILTDERFLHFQLRQDTGNAWWFCCALQSLFLQCASHRYQHFFGLLCRQHCAIAGLNHALLTFRSIFVAIYGK